MAARIGSFLIAFAAVAGMHAIGLSSLAAHLKPSQSLLEQRSEPLFTRTILAANSASAAALSIRKSKPAQSSTKIANETARPNPHPSAHPSPINSSIGSEPETELIKNTDSEQPSPTPPSEASPPPETATRTEPATAAASAPENSLQTQGQWPADTRVSYTMSGYYNGELYGKGQVQWTRSGLAADRYQIRVVIDAGLLELRMTSQGRISTEGLIPEVFEEYLKLAFKDPRIRPLKLESSELILANGKRLARPTREATDIQDTVSQFIDLGHRIQQGKAKLQTGEVISIWLARPGGLDQWLYDVGPQESIQLPSIGFVDVFPLKPRPIPNARGNIAMSMWLAPGLQYLPAKIRIDDRQTHIELLANRFDQR